MQKKHLKHKESNKFLYIVITAWVFVLTLFALNLTGFVPYYLDGTQSNAEKLATQKSKEEQKEREQAEKLKPKEEQIILPTRLVIPISGTDVPISNPDTTDIDELDRELLTSVVRFPGSGTLGADGNMLIFGHSTGYRNVRNEMFKAFNSLKTLEEGNFIKLVSGDTEYVYTVSNLTHEDASNVTVDFITEPGVKRLTLSTCDSFGKKSDRWIITADFIGSFPVEVESPAVETGA